MDKGQSLLFSEPVDIKGDFDWAEKKTIVLWFRTMKNSDVSTRLLARPFAGSLAPPRWWDSGCHEAALDHIVDRRKASPTMINDLSFSGFHCKSR